MKTIVFIFLFGASALASDVLPKPGLFHSLTEPPCSYCVNENRKGLLPQNERVLAWVRGAHNGGAFPIRYFIAGPRVINDTYGLFFYDPDGGYVAAYEKDYGYEFYGWRNGTMVVKGRDGSLWCALTGEAFEGPKKGERLKPIPSLQMSWGHWLLLHPESTAYSLFDGKKYSATELPAQVTAEAKQTMPRVDSRLEGDAAILGVELGKTTKAFPLKSDSERTCFTDEIEGTPLAVFYYKPTESAIAFKSTHKDQKLTFYADDISPETAPFKDKETGTRWTLAGRGIDGPLRGEELEWVPSIQCKWYAWVANHPETQVGGQTFTAANYRP
jgi:hypothetical protein